jgi:hypothetical protein
MSEEEKNKLNISMCQDLKVVWAKVERKVIKATDGLKENNWASWE